MYMVSSFKCRLLLTHRTIVRYRSDTYLDSTKTTGSFKKNLPEVYIPETHYRRGLRNLKKVQADKSIKNARNQNRKYAATAIDALMQGLTIPITKSINAYKETYQQLHPFEATVAELTIASRVKVGQPHLKDIIERMKRLRASTSKLGKYYAAQASNATSALAARELLQNTMKEMETLYTDNSEARCLSDLLSLQADLRRIPVIELDTPTIVLVGAPNVGKSSIVRVVSSGTPEVNDYPFTTRGVSIGHITDPIRSLRFQVMDTPGLLDRPVEERNEMEKLTFASLAHLPTAVMFVIDPTGMSGEKSTLEKQLSIRALLKERFPRRPWIDVVSKADMIIPKDIQDLLPENYLPVSVKENINIELLRDRIEEMLLELTRILLEMTKVEE